MTTNDELNKVLLRQEFAADTTPAAEDGEYMDAARRYAAVENAVAVLSDMAADASCIFCGGFAERLGIGRKGSCARIRSIWETDILRLVHPDDLRHKYIQELRFYHFTKRLPAARRFGCYLVGKLRMRDTAGNYIQVLHRMFYMPDAAGGIRFALCLYNPLSFDVPPGGAAVDSLTGEVVELGRRGDADILTVRERQILGLIAEGMMSKNIADTLSISVNTVSRHRQEILKKLQVRNSIEACRIAKDMGIIRT